MLDTGRLGDDSCYIVEPGPGNLEFQAVEDNVVIIDPIKQEPVAETEVDPLSGEIFIKPEPVESVEIKTENIFGFTLVDHGEKQLPLPQVREKGVPLFSCDLCSYTTKHCQVLGHHKRRVHNVKGKSKSSTYRNQPVVANRAGGPFKCDRCPFTAKLAQVLGSHKLRAHNVRGRKSLEELARKTHSVGSSTPVEENVEVEQSVEEKKNIVGEKEEVKVTRKARLPQHIGVPVVKRCPHCPFKSKFSGALAMHKKLKHHIEPEKKANEYGRYECEFCHQSYCSAGNLSRHMKLCRKRKNRHAAKCKRSCPYCGKTTFIEFQLRRHIENKHPDQWEKLKTAKQSTTHNVQQENLPRMGGTVEVRESVQGKEPSTGKYTCQLCPFQTDNFHILGLHKQIKHVKRDKTGQEGRFQCEHCHNSYSNYANLVRHSKQRHVNKPKRNCPFCRKTMFFEFTLHRHVERHHPDQWEKLKGKKQSSTRNVQEEHLPRKEETVNRVVKREPLYRKESSSDKYSCQLCQFRTEDFHILGLHKQIRHTKRRKNGQGGVLKCLFCPERYSFRSHLMRHVVTKHRGAWLKMERSTQQSNLQFKEADGEKLNVEIPSKPKMKFSNTSRYMNQSQCYESSKEVASTSNRFNDSTNSNSSWIDVKEEEVGQSEAAKKYCGTCDRFYNTSYHRYHTCKRLIKCGICSFGSVSEDKVHLHRARVHTKQGVVKEEGSDENKQRQEKQGRVVKGIERAGDSFQELVKCETASIGHSSVSEINDDEEYVPSTSTLKRKKVYLLNKPRRTCKQCKKSFHVSYFRYHRCVKSFECSAPGCSYSDSNLKRFRQHQRAYHPNPQNESGPTVSDEGPMSSEMKLTYAQQEEEMMVESVVNQPNECETDEKNDYPSQSAGEGMIFCVACNAHHNPNYLWKYVCYKQNIIQCNECSFVSSSKTYMRRHKVKQHSIKKLYAGNTQSGRKLKCQFCPLLFSKLHQLKNHLDMKHPEDTRQTKKKLSQDDLRLKLSQQSKPTWGVDIENVFVEEQSWGSQSDIYASTSTASEGSLMKQKTKKTCRQCRKSYNRDYFPHHRCSIEKHSQREKDKPSSNVAVEDTQPSEVIHPPSDIAVEVTQPSSAIEGMQLPVIIAVEGSQPLSNDTTEVFTPVPVIAKGFTEVLGDRVKCENCKMYFKTSAFQGHSCRPILRCQKCSFRTRIKTQMTLHSRKHLMDDMVVTEESLIQCKCCQKKFASRSWFMHHKLNECKRKPLHQCSLCHKKFYKEKNLESHMCQLHSDNNDNGTNDEKKDNDKESEATCPPV